MNAHLSTEELYSLFENHSSPSSKKAEQHLLACSLCRDEFEGLRNSIGTFRIAAIHLSEHRNTATAMQMPLNASRRLPFFSSPSTLWSTGLLAAAALCSISLPLVHRYGSMQQPSLSAAMHNSAPQQRAAGQLNTALLEGDDALLEGIDSDLATPIAPSLAPLAPVTNDKSSSSN